MEVDGVTVRSLFPLSKDLIHGDCGGAFGVVPREVNEERKRFQDEQEAEPNLWNRVKFFQHFNAAADQIAALYNAPPEQVTFVENATTGIECVLDSLNFQAGDSILVTSFTYGTFKWHIQRLTEKVGVVVQVIEVELPYTPDNIVKQYAEAFSKMQGQLKVALIDHITSRGAFLIPIERLIPLCSQFGILSLIDGAQAPGQLLSSEMNLARLQPDFYVANLHKWAFVPRGCAFLYVSKPFLNVVRPQVTCWLIEDTFRLRFSFLGCRDTTNIACVPAALRFTERLGGELAIRKFVVQLLRQGVDLILQALETERVCEEQYSAPHMAVIYLGPEFDARKDLLTAWRNTRCQDKFYLFTRQKLKISTHGLALVNGRVALRITAQVCNTLDDFRSLAAALVKLKKEMQTLTVEEALGQEIQNID